jgi:prepilin peptidase CpaA
MNVILGFTGLLLIVGALYDLRYRRIPNWLTFPAMIAGIAYHTYTGGMSFLLWSLLGMIAGFTVFFVFYVIGGMGAGDVKLMAAIGALLGPKDVLYAAAYTAIAGGIYAVILLAARRENRTAFARYGIMAKTFVMTGHFAPIPRDEGMKTTPLCYGVAIAIGTLIVLAQRIL